MQTRFTGSKPLQRNFTTDRLYAPHTGSNATFSGYLQQPDITGVLYVGTATQFNREVTNRQYPHIVPVLLAKQGHGTRLYCLIHGHDPGLDHRIGANLCIDEVFYLGKLLRCKRLIMREIKPQSFGFNQRPLLLHMLTQHRAQGCM